METTTLVAISISGLLVSFTGSDILASASSTPAFAVAEDKMLEILVSKERFYFLFLFTLLLLFWTLNYYFFLGH